MNAKEFLSRGINLERRVDKSIASCKRIALRACKNIIVAD